MSNTTLSATPVQAAPVPVGPVPLVDLKAAHAEVAAEVAAGMADVIARTAFVGGPEVGAFETEYAATSASTTSSASPAAPTPWRSRCGPWTCAPVTR